MREFIKAIKKVYDERAIRTSADYPSVQKLISYENPYKTDT